MTTKISPPLQSCHPESAPLSRTTSSSSISSSSSGCCCSSNSSRVPPTSTVDHDEDDDEGGTTLSLSISPSNLDRPAHIDAASDACSIKEELNVTRADSIRRPSVSASSPSSSSCRSSASPSPSPVVPAGKDDEEPPATARSPKKGGGRESDSGLESATDVDDEEEAAHADAHRHAEVLRRWLAAQASRQRDIATDDEFYCENRERLWPRGRARLKDLANCNYDPYPSLQRESYRYTGDRDRLGRPSGRGAAYFPNGRKFVGGFVAGIREGAGELFEREGGRIVNGNYRNDRLDGYCEIATNEGGVLEMTFDRGVAHGPARRFSPDGVLQWLGRYRFGVPFGTCWRSNDGEGWYVGTCNRSGRMTGANVIYLYPDLVTALVGRWNNDSMLAGRLHKTVGVTIEDGLLYPVVCPETPDVQETLFQTDISGYSKICSQPMLPDPYECARVVVRESQVPGGGEGLFARRDLPAGTVVAFYNGIRFHDCHAFNDWSHNSYKIRLNEKRKQILDIPPLDRDLHRYCATLAHKINHSFFPNARFSDFAHPRFGRILCVKVINRVLQGEELTCNYGYNLSDCPSWYKDLHDSLFFDSQATIPDL